MIARLVVAISVLSLAPALPVRSQQPDSAGNVVHPEIQRSVVDGIVDVGSVAMPDVWQQFHVFVWQYKTDAQSDYPLYEQAGLFSFHVDRGAGQADVVNWAASQHRPYYVDHAAGKGILHLTERTGLGELRDDGSLQARPQSLITKDSIQQLTSQIEANLEVAARGPAAAIALDDEVSLGNFNSPLEVDASPGSIWLFQQWLGKRYQAIEQLNLQWGTSFTSFDQVEPENFESVRARIAGQPFSQWNLSRWMDWRSYMDTQFSATIAHLVRFAGDSIPNASTGIPVGIVGGQQPSPYGGFDYEKLCKSVQWIESYDIGGTNELLTSLWHDSRRPIVQTYFATGDERKDAWFLWYYWAHGNAAVIAWPDMAGKPWFNNGRVREEIKQLEPTFREVQSDGLSQLRNPETKLQYDPIAILYSHDSVQLSWATDALVHGKTWPRRSSSLDNNCSSAGKNRVAWSKLLEDCGFQARWISVEQLESGELESGKFRALILPRALALSDASCDAVRNFHVNGGAVIADYWTGLFDQYGKARVRDGVLRGGLDDLFKVRRDEQAGYFDGLSMTEVNGELYNKPLLDRLPKDVIKNNGITVVERGTEVAYPFGGDKIPQAVYLNLSPVAYYEAGYRTSERGETWRRELTTILASFGLRPQVSVTLNGKSVPMFEVLRWNHGDKQWIVVVANPTRDATISSAGQADGLDFQGEVVLQFATAHSGATNVRTAETYPPGSEVKIQFDASSATILELSQ